MTDDQVREDMESLLARPAFLRFLYRHAIQTAGLLDRTGGSSQGRNLDYHEGRRDLALEMLADAEKGQPASHPEYPPILTTIQILREAAQSASKEKKSDARYDRNRDLGSDDEPGEP